MSEVMDLESYLRFVFALIFVLGLFGVVALLVRRYGIGYRAPVRRGKMGRRLAIQEVMPLDAKRRLVLVSRDDEEHLILLGAGSDEVVERNISAKEAGFAATLEREVDAGNEGQPDTSEKGNVA